MPIQMEERPSIQKRIRPNAAPGYILIVDDEEQNRTLLRDPLEAHGHKVAEAASGQEALELIAEKAPDVVLLDLMMPGMNGFEVCRVLKEDTKTAPIPILMITALTDRKERLMGIQAGANDFLNKPIDITDVILRAGNAIYTKHLHDQLQVERQKSESLLESILPKGIAERMKNGEVTIADSYEQVTVLVAHLVGFLGLADHISPDQLVGFLNEIFSTFDELVEKRGLQKIKTVGDVYVAAGGLQGAEGEAVEAIAELSLEMKTELERFNEQYNTSIQICIGISTGSTVAGVIGRKSFAYDLWGETVNRAFLLETLGSPGSIETSESSYELLREKYAFLPEQRLREAGGREVTSRRLCGRLS
jgi:adenylate cyclase